MHKVQLLAPARNLENLKIAIAYGADAVYIGGEAFGIIGSTKDYTKEEMIEGIKFAHDRDKKVYVTVNVLPHNDDFIQLEKYLLGLEKIGVDALIIADPGVLDIVKKVVPNMELHLGSQANTTNYVSANFWYEQGIKRVVATRELSCEEIAQIRANTPLDLDIEAFVHGEICISYSGRCLISSYIRGNSKEVSLEELRNREYSLMEEKRPGEYYPVYEDERGTFLFNSKDLCMIGNISDLIKSGVTSLKIEARMKDSYYIAAVVRAYRMAIDAFYKDPTKWKLEHVWLEELKKGSYRDFTTGFYLSENSEDAIIEEVDTVSKPYECIGIVVDVDQNNQVALIKTKGNINVLEKIEVIAPYTDTIVATIEELYDEDENSMESISDLNRLVKVKLSTKVYKDYMLRREIKNDKN